MGKLKAMGFTGIYKLTYLNAIGGCTSLSNGRFALFSEYLLLIKAARENKVGYIHNDLIYYFVHDESWGNINSQLDLYEEAGYNLLKACELTLANLDESFKKFVLLKIAKLVFHEYAKKCWLQRAFSGYEKAKYFFNSYIQQYIKINSIQDYLVKFIPRIILVQYLIFPFIKSKSKKLLSQDFLKLMQKLHSFFQ